MNCIKNERIKIIMYKKWTYKKWNSKKWMYKKWAYKEWTNKKKNWSLFCFLTLISSHYLPFRTTFPFFSTLLVFPFLFLDLTPFLSLPCFRAFSFFSSTPFSSFLIILSPYFFSCCIFPFFTFSLFFFLWRIILMLHAPLILESYYCS